MSELDSKWTWAFTDRNGAQPQLPETAPTPPTFASQSDAETWIGENWRELLELNVASVTLLKDEAEVYQMGLDPA